jgi:chromosome partitioning protein
MSDKNFLGLAEVAELLDTSRQTIVNWRSRRPDFPPPIEELRSGPIWTRKSIVDWAEKVGVEISETPEESDDAQSKPRGTTIAVTNMKGGVGKSTLTANLGWYGAYYFDLKVLLIDLDPQFNLSQYILGTAGYEEHLKSEKKTALNVFEQRTPVELASEADPRVQPEEVISHVKKWRDGGVLDLLPSSLNLSFTLKNPMGKEQLLDNFLSELRTHYDLIMIDCPPTESMLTTAAYYASEAVLIPVKPEFLSTIGLPLVVKSLSEFKQNYQREIDVLGIVFNASAPKLEDDRSRSFVRKTAKEHGWPVFKNSVSQSDSYPKGSRFGTPIFLTDYARASKIADFEAVADEFFEKLGIT